MENTASDINILIIRYLDGSATLEEKVQLLQWLKASSKNRDDFTDTRDLWLSCNAVADNEIEVDIALDRLKMRIVNEHERQSKKSVLSFTHWYRVVAVIVVLLGFTYWISRNEKQPETKLIVQNQLITAKGSKGKFTLPDGTVVWLNSESRLVYPDQFDDGKRVVNLSGGAYFEVARNEKKPFIVQAGEVDVEVLGTKFNISSYPYKEYIETALLNGSVKIGRKGVNRDIILTPNQVFELEKGNHLSTVKATNASLYADWIKDRLVFDNGRLSDILISMQGWYNMDIECPEQFARTTRMSFTIRQENIEEILKAMSFIIPINYRIRNGKAYIIPE